MDLFHNLYKNIPIFLSIQLLMTFFFLYKSIMTMSKNKAITFDFQPENQRENQTENQSIKYEDKYKNRYIKLETKNLTPSEKDNLKNNFIMETTPLGNVIMYYNIDKNGFVYYSDSTIPYRFLETVARKYIISFQCKDPSIYVDEMDNDDEKKPIEIAMDQSSDAKPIRKVSVNATNKKVFAKFKNYNHPNSIPSTSMIAKNNSNPQPNKKTTQSIKEVKENKNKYISEGKIINFSFIKKIDKKQIVKRLNMTFAEFKKMQQESKNKTSL